MTDRVNKPLGQHEEKRKENEEEAQHREQERLSDYSKVLEIVEGRRVLWDVISKGNVFSSCFNLNPIVMANLEGRRDVSMDVYLTVRKAGPERFIQMQREAANLRKEKKEKSKNA